MLSKVETRGKITKSIRTFYEEYSFPGYEDFDDLYSLIQKAERSIYAKLLDQQLPCAANILEVGCGTGQLTIFLSIKNRKTIGIDLSRNSLMKGMEFRDKFNLKNAKFLQMDIFDIAFKNESFDYIFCNGVLHHTYDARGGFEILCNLLKKDGYIAVGLYNKFGRFITNFQKSIFKIFKKNIEKKDNEKKAVWFMDQFRNPFETGHSVGEVLEWFEENRIKYINSIPKISFSEEFSMEEKLFQEHQKGTKIEHLFSQLGWIFTKFREGGLFIMIGKKL